MSDHIEQQYRLDASQFLQELVKVDTALIKHGSNLDSLAAKLNNFNSQTGSAFQKTAQVGVSSFNKLTASGQSAATTLSGSFNQLISVNGQYSTSLGLLSRIVFTQAVVAGFREIRTAIEDSIQASIAFQKQLSEIKSIDSDKILGADVGDKLRGISSDFNIPLPQVATGAYEALSAQVLKTGSDFRFMTTAAEFSKGSLTSMGATIKGLAGGLNAYGQGVESADRLASQFNETIRLGTIRGEELASGFGTVATLGHQLGVSQAELLASVAALTNAGVPQAQAFTQIRAVMTGLVKPSSELTKVFRENGIASAEDLIATKGLGGALQFLLSQTNGTTAGTAELFRNQRAMLGVLSLGGQNARTYAEDLKAIDGVMSSLNSERAQQVMASDAEQLTKKWNQLRVSLIPVGDGFVTVANKGLDSAAVLRDFAVAVLDSTGSLARGKPRVDEFANAWLHLQGLFGKDLAVGDFGGKIVSEVELRARQLDIISKRRAEDEGQAAKIAGEEQQALNKIKFAALADFKARNRELQTEAQSAANLLTSTEKAKITELSRQLRQTHSLLRESPGKIGGIEGRQERRDFDTRTANLDDPQRSLALVNRALNQSSVAGVALEAAGRSSTPKEAIERARALFESAQSTAEEAKSLAESAGDRRAALFAGRQLQAISSQQATAERTLAASLQSRIPLLQQQRGEQQASLDLITKATKELIKNSSVLDKKGNPLPDDQLSKQAEARKRALASLAAQGVSNDTIASLSFKTDTSKLAAEIKESLAKIDASPFQTIENAIRGSVESAQDVAVAYERAARAAALLNRTAPSPGPSPAPHAAGGLIQAYSEGGFVMPDYFANGGSAAARGTDTVPAMLTPGEFVVNASASAKFYSQLQAINTGKDPYSAVEGGSTNIDQSIGSIVVNGGDSPKQTARVVIDAIRREQRRGSGNPLN